MDSNAIAPTDFKNRKAGLVVFGVLTILMGCFCGLLVLLLIASPMLAAKSASPPPPPHSTMFGAALYGGMTIAFIWLGIGSIMARRWARALLAIWSWSWLITGAIYVVIMAIMAPRFKEALATARPPGQAELPPSTQLTMMVIIFLIFGIMFVLLPLLWALFYSGKNVKATCEALDPVVRWTDRCPLPVLAMSLWLGFGGLTMLLCATRSPMPVFGMLVSGWPASVLFVLVALIWAYSARALYHLDRRGWWVIFSAMLLFFISNVITYSRHDLGEIYALMGYSTEQTAAVQRLGLMGGKLMILSSLAAVPFLGYLWYIRKFLPSRPPTDALTS